jgi:heptosyltransferase-2
LVDSRHQVFDSDAILARLVIPGADPGWRPALAPHLLEEARTLLRAAGLWNRTLVGLAPSAAWGESKRWPCERFGHLARRLVGDGLQSVVLIGPGEEDVAEQVQAAAGASVPTVGAGLDLAGLAAVMAFVSVVVGNDSGPVHLAGLSGASTVALFGPTDPRRTAPLGGLVVSDNLRCSPCFARVCPLDHNRCLRELAVETVLAAVQELLEERAGLTAQSGAG